MKESNNEKKLRLIKEREAEKQFEIFFEELEKGESVPAVVPLSFDENTISNMEIPEKADFAVSTSGTKGKPKLYFRTKESWRGFLQIQNKVFGITQKSRIFITGSLAFTGNMNIAFDAHFTGSFLKASSSLRADEWANDIEKNEIDTIYMIPDKITHLATLGRDFPNVKTVLLGSQFVGKRQFERFRTAFPKARFILYYGASETNYISYKELNETNVTDSTCVGRIFDKVQTDISYEGHILVKSDFCVLGISGFFDTADMGRIENGELYLTGRADDVINIHGEKINKSRIEEILMGIDGVEEAFVETENGRITAHIAGKNLPDRIPKNAFSKIEKVFIPKKYVRHSRLPKNESGKTVNPHPL